MICGNLVSSAYRNPNSSLELLSDGSEAFDPADSKGRRRFHTACQDDLAVAWHMTPQMERLLRSLPVKADRKTHDRNSLLLQ